MTETLVGIEADSGAEFIVNPRYIVVMQRFIDKSGQLRVYDPGRDRVVLYSFSASEIERFGRALHDAGLNTVMVRK